MRAGREHAGAGEEGQLRLDVRLPDDALESAPIRAVADVHSSDVSHAGFDIMEDAVYGGPANGGRISPGPRTARARRRAAWCLSACPERHEELAQPVGVSRSFNLAATLARARRISLMPARPSAPLRRQRDDALQLPAARPQCELQEDDCSVVVSS